MCSPFVFSHTHNLTSSPLYITHLLVPCSHVIQCLGRSSPPWELPTEVTSRENVGAASSSGGAGNMGSNTTGIVCHRCRAPGHKAPQCPLGSGNENVVCHTCGTPGHKTPQCPRNEGVNRRANIVCFKASLGSFCILFSTHLGCLYTF